ncbi:hypothetical protein ACWD6I_03200, partial [Streptomyces sp. NPDC002454]
MLRRIRLHYLRHSAATVLPKQGVALVAIKELLGPARIDVAAGTYAHYGRASDAGPSTSWATHRCGRRLRGAVA